MNEPDTLNKQVVYTIFAQTARSLDEKLATNRPLEKIHTEPEKLLLKLNKRHSENASPPVVPTYQPYSLEVSNGTGRRRMAARFRDYLAHHGASVLSLTNADHYRHMTTTLYYRADYVIQATDLSASVSVDFTLNSSPEHAPDV